MTQPIACAAPGPALRLIWFHHAGGHGASYQSWRSLFPPEWDCVFLEYPGRGAQAHLAPARTMAQLADALLATAALLLDRPYALFGHSMGSLVALEFARRAQALHGRAPCWIGVSGHHAPQHDSTLRYRLHRLSEPALAQTLALLGNDPLAFLNEPAQRSAALALLRADLEACETYRAAPAPVLDCAMSAFLGAADPMVSLAQMQPWSALANGAFHLRQFEGGHFYLTAHKRALAACIIADLQRAVSEHPLVPTPPRKDPHD